MRMLLAGLAVVAAVVGAGIGYAGMKTAALPDWYQADRNESLVSETAATANSPQSRPVSASQAAAPGDVVISSGELNQMVSDAIASQPYTAPILEVAKGINTSLDNDRIESGVVMNLSELPLEALPAEGQQAISQLTETFPFLRDRDVYLGIEGAPKVVEGALSLDDTHIKVGQLKLPIAAIADQIGISQAQIEQQLGAVLSQQGLSPEDVQIVDGQLIIRGAAQ